MVLKHGIETQIIILMCAMSSYPGFIDWAKKGYCLDDIMLFNLLLINGVVLIAFGLGFTLCRSRYSSRKDEYSVSEWAISCALFYAVGFLGMPVYAVCEKFYKTLEGPWRSALESMF